MTNTGKPIISSLLDTDKYKFSMQQVNFHQYPGAMAKYRFKCRTPGIDFAPLLPAIREQFALVGELRFAEEELRYLQTEPHLSPDFIDFLSDFRVDPGHVHVSLRGGELDIVAEGPMLRACLWEIYVLAIVNELWFRHSVTEPDYAEGRRRLADKIQLIKQQPDMDGFNFTDFGTRRRFSKQWQGEVLTTLQHRLPEHFAGTSNYHYAHRLGLRPIGTMAHEYLQTWQALTHPLDAQKAAFNAWAQEFRGSLGDALTDVVGMDSFCEILDLYFAKQFDGFRHDSGDPSIWCDKLIHRLHELNINPRSKRAIWSDGLNVGEMLRLHQQFKHIIQTGFGIGTNLTNDLGHPAINIVMKLVEVNNRPVAKLSDTPGKSMCENPEYLAWFAAAHGRKSEFSH